MDNIKKAKNVTSVAKVFDKRKKTGLNEINKAKINDEDLLKYMRNKLYEVVIPTTPRIIVDNLRISNEKPNR
jgi:hypothetical protein